MTERFYIRILTEGNGWVECSRKEYLHAQRVAGFSSQYSGGPATRSFDGFELSGKIVNDNSGEQDSGPQQHP